jgi:hypothetical protein
MSSCFSHSFRVHVNDAVIKFKHKIVWQIDLLISILGTNVKKLCFALVIPSPLISCDNSVAKVVAAT